jgi:hypothetical protein
MPNFGSFFAFRNLFKNKNNTDEHTLSIVYILPKPTSLVVSNISFLYFLLCFNPVRQVAIQQSEDQFHFLLGLSVRRIQNKVTI